MFKMCARRKERFMEVSEVKIVLKLKKFLPLNNRGNNKP